jgi:hypothetical protein
MLAMTGFRARLPHDETLGTVIAFDTIAGLPVTETWTVQPWACGGTLRIAGPGFKLTLTTDDQCRVTAVQETQGL